MSKEELKKPTLRFTRATPNTLIELYKNLDLEVMNDLMKNIFDSVKEESNEREATQANTQAAQEAERVRDQGE